MDLFDLTGKNAVVTGGAHGLGYGIARALLEKGAAVAVIDVSKDISAAIEELKKTGRVHGIAGNLLDRSERKRAFDDAVRILGGGRLDILVNNAGIQHRGNLIDFPDEKWDEVLELNLTAVFSLCKYAGAYMVRQKSGKIINIASMNSFFGGTNVPAYAASKGAIVQLTKAISNEWSKYNINANCIAPGFMETALTEDIMNNQTEYQFKLKRIPIGRWGKPGDLTGVIQFLAGAASDYVCGTVIPLDGGYLNK
jgi:2-deoxy-D-gluconate 3-dehydrogenase